jgi:phospholipid/cholesterol/gamma-HCH transport system ATP-binding protein
MPAEPILEFKDVSLRYGDSWALRNISLTLEPGETRIIFGAAGSGKTTLLKAVIGLVQVDQGSISLYGQDVTKLTETELFVLRRRAGVLFQEGGLFDSLTVGENVAFPLRERRQLSEEQIYQIVDGLLQMVGVQEMRDLLPSDLSTGMKRSVAIARALAARPECVLYDEPTTMVDPLMAQLLGDLIKRLKIQLNLTSIVVTHDMRLAKKLAERVMFLHEGRAIFFGPYGEMEKSTEPIIQEFLELDELKLEA